MPDKKEKISFVVEILGSLLQRIGNVNLEDAIDWVTVEQNARVLKEEAEKENL